jgi:hypothetical protein
MIDYLYKIYLTGKLDRLSPHNGIILEECSMGENAEQSNERSYQYEDQFVSLLFGACFGFVVWGIGAGIVWLINYFKFEPPVSQLTLYFIELAYLNVPWITAVLAGMIGYKKVLLLD